MENKKINTIGIISIVFAVLNAIGLLVSVGYSLHMQHKFLEVFTDLEVSLPIITQLFLNIHWAIWVFATFILLTILAVKELISKKWIPLLINGLFVIMGVIYWIIFAIAMMLPMFNIIKELENG